MILTDVFSNPTVTTYSVGKNVAKDQRASQPFTAPIFKLNQCHTNHCLILRSQDDLGSEDLRKPADAVLTDLTDVVLSLYTADCVPILLYHPSGIIGAIHAGRKGTELGVLREALLSLKAVWGVEKDVSFWFGPAICKDCYQIEKSTDLRYDLRAKNTQQAEEVFKDKTIKILYSEYCTSHDNSLWHSYRREGADVVRNHSYISLTSFAQP